MGHADLHFYFHSVTMKNSPWTHYPQPLASLDLKGDAMGQGQRKKVTLEHTRNLLLISRLCCEIRI